MCKACWIQLSKKNKQKLDLLSGDLDCSHSMALNCGGEMVYQGMKKLKTTYSTYLTDCQRLLLAISEPVSEDHNNLFDIEVYFEEITGTLEQVDISTHGLFINSDDGFDSQELRYQCERKGIIANIEPKQAKRVE